MTPNSGPSLENLIFDPTYYGLAAVIVVLSLCAVLVSLRNAYGFEAGAERGRALGTGMAAFGFTTIMVSAVLLLALFRTGLLGGFLYLQTEFIAVYAGCLMIMYGLDKALFARLSHRMKKFPRTALWTVFISSVGIAAAYLADPMTYTVTTTGGVQHVAQEAVFWLPPFVTMVAGAVGLPLLSAVTVRTRETAVRGPALWFALFFVLGIVGALKESNLIPSLGDPLVDLLAAFVPFTCGSICLLISAVRLHPQGLAGAETTPPDPRMFNRTRVHSTAGCSRTSSPQSESAR